MQAKKSSHEIPIRYIKSVGPKKSDIFQKLGLENVSDLFYYLPRRYEDRSKVISVKDARPGEPQAVMGKVLKMNAFRARTGTYIFEMAVGDDKNRLFGVWYNLPFMSKTFKVGQTVVLYGKVESPKRLQITHPAYEILDKEDLKGSLDVGRIVPIYSLTADLSQRYMRKVVHNAMAGYLGQVKDCLPTALRARKKLVDFKFAIENIHFPYSSENLERAYKRLVFEEFFVLQVVMALRRMKDRKKGIKHQVREGLLDEFEGLFDFSLTREQKKCIKDLEEDMSSERPMYRLLQGDVGSGKTAIAMYALLLSARNGYQSAMMAPTEILARQHYVTVSKTFMPFGINVRLLINGIDADSKGKIKEELKSGNADIVIGTHSLIQEHVDYSDLGLIVIDEQHKFGVAQRSTLRRKGDMPDTLVMTATPIPRSLALTVYGDMDLSMLKEKPAEREAVTVTTYWVEEDRRKAVYELIRGEIAEGRQAFIVYPRIKKTNASEMLAAEEMYEHLKDDVFSDLRMGLVHGQMKANGKDRVMEDFRKGNYDILVATTVIEVGVDIPNVTVMLVEHAERYGLAQLHQLRGRIGRGKHTSYCILMGEPKTEASRERLSMMMETDDGFRIAEKDLDIRGPGEFLGKRQSGIPELRFGNIIRDFSIMEEAREEAFSLVKEDPGLQDPHNLGIRENIAERFGGKLKI
ncbi:ATP-dependent DNA helicase RecG [Candidatus Omnitrophota bacterium]